MAGIIEGPFRYIVGVPVGFNYREIVSAYLPLLSSSATPENTHSFFIQEFSPLRYSINQAITLQGRIVHLESGEFELPVSAFSGGHASAEVLVPFGPLCNDQTNLSKFTATTLAGVPLSAHLLKTQRSGADYRWRFFGGPDWIGQSTVVIKTWVGQRSNTDNLVLEPYGPDEGDTEYDARCRAMIGSLQAGPWLNATVEDSLYGNGFIQSRVDMSGSLGSLWGGQSYMPVLSSRPMYSMASFVRTSPTQLSTATTLEMATYYEPVGGVNMDENFFTLYNQARLDGFSRNWPAAWGSSPSIPSDVTVVDVVERLVGNVQHFDLKYTVAGEPGGEIHTASSILVQDMNAVAASITGRLEAFLPGFEPSLWRWAHIWAPQGTVFTAQVADEAKSRKTAYDGGIYFDRQFLLNS